jgi:hypothetical protein
VELIKRGSSEGVWFEYGEGAAFKVRRIPTGLDRETYFRCFGKRAEVRRKDGAVISDTNLEASQRYTQELARYALVDSRNAEVPAEYAKAAGIEVETELASLDGLWSDKVKEVIFAEVPSLAAWVLAKANSLTAQAAEEDAALGKT